MAQHASGHDVSALWRFSLKDSYSAPQTWINTVSHTYRHITFCEYNIRANRITIWLICFAIDENQTFVEGNTLKTSQTGFWTVGPLTLPPPIPD